MENQEKEAEILKIRNFIVIKKAEFNLKKINIIIGPQAQGKSLVAKMAFFIRNIQSNIISSLRQKDTVTELNTSLKQEFEKRFPRYSWDGTDFSIQYSYGPIEINIKGIKNSKNKTTLFITLGRCLIKEFNKRKKHFISAEEKFTESSAFRKPREDWEIFYEHVLDPLRNGELSRFFADSIFIPASRTFFANLQKNIFTFLSSNVSIDPYLKDFGSSYERAKSFHRSNFIKMFNERAEILKAMEAIIDGEYEFKDDQDWIKNKERKINLSHASSGQQESLPMLLTLFVLPYINTKNSSNRMFFIEEPEAHLFPTSQGLIMSIISSLKNQLGVSFFITTHSPYILTALNNLILAHEAISDKKISLKEFQKLNKSGYPIAISDVSAYTMYDGQLKSIVNEEIGIIGADMLDSVSDHFENVTNHLLCLE